VAHLRGVLWGFGWGEEGLGTIDKDLPRDDYRGEKGSAQRYADQYAWIGLYTYPGMLDHYNRLWHGNRAPDGQIDPSFPDPAPLAPISLPAWARVTPTDDRRWIRNGVVAVPDEQFYVPEIDSTPGPWIAVCGYLNSRTKVPDRGVFGFLRALHVNAKDAGRLVDALNRREYPGNEWLPRVPETYYTFAGETPWSPEFRPRC
jgi:hypothetical protein